MVPQPTSHLPPEALDEVISVALGPDLVWSRLNTEYVTPISVLIEEATSQLDWPVEVYWVDGGPPMSYSAPGLFPAPVTFNARLVEISATLVRLVRQSGLLGENMLRSSAERVCLQVLAELVLKGGDPATGTYLFTRSLVFTDPFILVPSTIEALEAEPRTESYMMVWFYGLAHEISHVAAKHQPRALDLSEADLDRRIDEAILAYPFPSGVADELMREAEGRRQRHSLQSAWLREEIHADVAGVQALWRATKRVMALDGTKEFDGGDFALAAVEMFNVMGLLNGCARAALYATQPAVDPRDDPWFNVANTVRADFVVDCLAGLIAEETTDDDPHSCQWWAEALRDAVAANSEHLDTIEAGQARAVRQVLWIAEREQGLADRLKHEAATRPFMAVEIANFLDLVEELRIDHPDVDWLRQIQQRPMSQTRPPTQRQTLGGTLSRALGRALGRTRARGTESRTGGPQAAQGLLEYCLLWVRGPNEFAEPFGVDTRFGWLVFVFLGQDDLYESFRDASQTGLAAGFTLEDAALFSEQEWEVATTVARSVQPQRRPRCRVLFQGTESFDEMVQHLAKGSY